MASFSGGVKLGDLDDFIGLNQECVVTLIEIAEGGAKSAKIDNVDASFVAPVLVQRPNLIKAKQSQDGDKTAKVASVTLSDCLACSGCVTSAETVLLQQQSGEEFLRRVAEAPLSVVSISGEARSSLAAQLNMSPALALQKIATVLSSYGVDYVLEGSAAEAIALLEGSAEFMQRFNATAKNPASKATMPLITSHCPGWTLYAEKIVDPVIIPHLAPLRPPQQIQGRLVKTCMLQAHNQRRFHRWWRSQSVLFAAENGLFPSRSPTFARVAACEPISPQQVYHVSVQPCYDRKIEASRPQFELSEFSGETEEEKVREVDTVLTTSELLELIEGAAGNQVPGVPAESGAAAVMEAVTAASWNGEVLTDLFLGNLVREGRPLPLICPVSANGASGGFVEHVFREAALELFQTRAPTSLNFRTTQNEDMREVVLEDPKTKRVLLKFTAAYGFRNIQNIIRRITKSSSRQIPECGHFVEIMACPGGCLNGGGQIPLQKADGTTPDRADRQTHLRRLEGLLHACDANTSYVRPVEHPLVLQLYRYMAAAGSATTGMPNQAVVAPSLDSLVGTEAARHWLLAEWRSLKVDAEGKPITGTAALKW